MGRAEAPEALWLRAPAISPDGARIAFSHAGQIWTVGAAGGQAVALTSGPWHATAPVWSPDGQTLAFAADRHGQYDVFAIPTAGGPVQRLTHHSAADIPMGFTPDGGEVVFTSARLGDATADAMNAVYGLGGLYQRPYAVPVAGGRTRALLPTTALNPAFGPEGRMLYEDNPSVVENGWRKHQVSDAARDIWRHDPATGTHERLTEFRGEDRDQQWTPDGAGMVWLSERGGSFNVWRQETDGAAPEQVTFHEDWPVRFLSSADDGTLAYAYDGALWRLDPGADAPERLTVTIARGSLLDTVSARDVTGEVSEIAVAPGGAEVAFVTRGEVFVTGLDTGVTRRITDTVAKERDIAFSADGRRLVYASERGGTWDIYETAVEGDGARFSDPVALTERVLIRDDADLFGPKLDPEGRRVAHIRDRAELRVHDLDTGDALTVQPDDGAYSYNDGDLSLEWSPDGDWILSRTGLFGSSEVALLAADGSARHNLSRNGYVDVRAHFAPSGEAVLWLSDRYGLRTSDGETAQMDVMGAFLTRAAHERLHRTPAERARAARTPPEQGAVAPAETIPELEGLRARTERLTGRSGDYGLFALLPDGTSLLTVEATPAGLYEATVRDLASGAERQVFALPAPQVLDMALEPGNTALVVMSPGSLTRHDLAGGPPQTVPVSARIARDIRAEVDYIIRSNWRATEQTFYRADMQGVDWEGVRDHYLRFAPHISHWEDLADLLGEMVGELNASHQSPGYRGADPLADATGALGLYYDGSHAGAGMRIAAVLPGGPADRIDSPLVPGATIMAVDGQPVDETDHIHRHLNRTAGQEIRLSVAPPYGGATVQHVVTPVGLAEEIELAYRAWVDSRRALVRELSDGRLGYIHLRAMMPGPYRTAYGDLFGLHGAAEGVVVDIRNNGGGNLHAALIVMLTGTHVADNRARAGHVVTSIPEGRWTRPSVLLQNAGSYSDASVFPMLYQARGVGRIVGDRTPGTGTAVSEVPQLEAGLRYRVPELGFQLTDGTWFENTEIVPDLLVRNDPDRLAAGRDAQLEAAVRDLLEQLD